MSPSRLGQLARSGELASVRVEGRLMFKADSVEAYRSRSVADGVPSAAGSETWDAELSSLTSWLGDVSDALAPFQGQAALPYTLPAEEEVPIEVEEEPEPPAVPAAVVETPAPPAAEPDTEPKPEPSPEPTAIAAPAPEPEPVLAATPAPPPPPPASPAAPAVEAARSGRQFLLAVQPVTRFAVLKEVTEALKRVGGIVEVRLERLDSGIASYRVTFGDQRPNDEVLGKAVSGLGLSLYVVQ